MLEQLMKPKDYIFVSEFDDSTLETFIADFSRLEQDPIISVIAIYVSSYGGESHVVMAMRDMIKSSPKPVATIAIGKAMSAGASLLAAGTPNYRFASESTEIMIHDMSSGEVGKAADIVQAAGDLARFSEYYFQCLANDIGQTIEFIKEELRNRNNSDWSMTAKEAKKIGLIDHIGFPRLGFSPAQGVLAMIEKDKKKRRKS